MSKTSDAVDRLAGVVELGHLHTMSGEAAPLLLAAADEIESLRDDLKREKKCRLDMDESWRKSMASRSIDAAQALGLPGLGDDWLSIITAIKTVTANLADARERVRVAESKGSA